MDEALRHANVLGLRVAFRDLGKRHGELRTGGLVVLNQNRPIVMQKETLLHECGHHVLGHDHRGGRWSAADERAADLYAAQWLISPLEYAMAEQAYGSDPRTIARELEISLQYVLVYRDHHDGRGRSVRMDDAVA